MRAAVIGAGPAGLTAALRLARQGVDVDVFEASGEVGGMCRSFRLWDQTVDLGPHRFFSADPDVNRLWLEMAGNDFHMVDRLTRIYYRGRFFLYPLQLADVVRRMPLLDATGCLASYCREKIKPAHADGGESFESWVTAAFGRRLFEIFFKTYSEKLWGLPCTELDADFAVQRIKRFSLGQAITHMLHVRRAQHKTLVDRFAYPTGGTGMIYERMASEVERLGGRIHRHAPVREIIRRKRRVQGLRLADGRLVSTDHIISSMPLTHLIRGLGAVPASVEEAAGRLQFRNTILVYLHVSPPNPFHDQWIYVHAPELQTGRITNFRNWAPELYGSAASAVLALEYWCYDDDSVWRDSDQQLISRATTEMAATGLLRRERVLDGHVVRVRRSYPVYRVGYREVLRPIRAFLSAFENLSVIGRYGSFRYNNQDHSILMGLRAAENVVNGASHDLWSVNTADEYQEAAALQTTGSVAGRTSAALARAA
jgi:protoporphyrinogen oxidase